MRSFGENGSGVRWVPAPNLKAYGILRRYEFYQREWSEFYSRMMKKVQEIGYPRIREQAEAEGINMEILARKDQPRVAELAHTMNKALQAKTKVTAAVDGEVLKVQVKIEDSEPLLYTFPAKTWRKKQ